MKYIPVINRVSFFILAILISLTIHTSTTYAANAQWDATIGTVGIQDGAGTWDTTLFNWIKAGANAAFVALDDAVFGAGASGTAGTVTLSTPISVNSLTFNNPFAGNYTITGSTLTLGGTGSINAVNDTTISSILCGYGRTY